jgi:hypothetical protein
VTSAPGKRHALTLAAGKLAGEVLDPMAETDALEHLHRGGARFRRRHPPDRERHRDVLERGELRQQVMELVDEAERAIAHGAARGFGERGERDAVDEDLTAGRRVEPAEQVQQRALAGARGADDRHALAWRDREIDAEQHGHFERAAAIGLREPAADEHGPCGTRVTRGAAFHHERCITHSAARRPD